MSSVNSIHEITDEDITNANLKCKGCGGKEWVFRADCKLECVLCQGTEDVSDLVRQWRMSTGHWISTDH